VKLWRIAIIAHGDCENGVGDGGYDCLEDDDEDSCDDNDEDNVDEEDLSEADGEEENERIGRWVEALP
jgi:hypothetical protein